MIASFNYKPKIIFLRLSVLDLFSIVYLCSYLLSCLAKIQDLLGITLGRITLDARSRVTLLLLMLKVICWDDNDCVFKSLVSHEYSILIFLKSSSIANINT